MTVEQRGTDGPQGIDPADLEYDPPGARLDGRHRRGASRLRRGAPGHRPDVQGRQEDPSPREASRDRRRRPGRGRGDRNRGAGPHRRRDPRHPARHHRRSSDRGRPAEAAPLLHLQAAVHAGGLLLPPALPRLRGDEPRQARRPHRPQRQARAAHRRSREDRHVHRAAPAAGWRTHHDHDPLSPGCRAPLLLPARRRTSGCTACAWSASTCATPPR